MPHTGIRQRGIGPGPATLQYQFNLNKGYGLDYGRTAIDNLMHDLERGNQSFVLQLRVQPTSHPDAQAVTRQLTDYARKQGLKVVPWHAPIS